MRTRKPARRPIPVNLIAGPLGVGKTTALNHLLRQRPAAERWAVLVNEYGQIGLDAALLDEAARPQGRQGAVEVRELVGGCICCTAGVMFEAALVQLLRRRPDRLLIEPTGLATVSGILDVLARPGIRKVVDLRSVITLVDPTREASDPLRVEAEDQILAADILLASRSDLASEAQLQAFESWAGELFPPKRLVARVEQGQVPVELLDLAIERAVEAGSSAERVELHSHDTATKAGHEHAQRERVASSILRREHQTSLASTIGWVIPAERSFVSARLMPWVEALSSKGELRRLKAVLKTDQGWQSLNIADGARELRASGYRRDSRLELIWTGSSRPDPDALERELLDCLAPQAAESSVSSSDSGSRRRT